MKGKLYSSPSVKTVKTAVRAGVCIQESLYGAAGAAGVYDKDNDIIYDPDDIVF